MRCDAPHEIGLSFFLQSDAEDTIRNLPLFFTQPWIVSLKAVVGTAMSAVAKKPSRAVRMSDSLSTSHPAKSILIQGDQEGNPVQFAGSLAMQKFGDMETLS